MLLELPTNIGDENVYVEHISFDALLPRKYVPYAGVPSPLESKFVAKYKPIPFVEESSSYIILTE